MKTMKGEEQDREDVEVGTVELEEVDPPILQGWIEKKGTKKFGVSGGWQPRYFTIVKPGVLVYYKDPKMEGEPNGELNLGLVMNFTISTKDEGERDDGDSKVKLGLDLADKTFKMRFPDMEEATKWREALVAWKEYIVKNGSSVPSFVNRESEAPLSSSEKGAYRDFEASEDTASVEDETARLTKNMQSSSQTSIDISSKYSTELSDKPSELQGWLEKKQKAKFGKMAQWQKRYFRVDEASGSLLYFKSTNPSETPAGSIDLKMIVEVAAAEKDGKVDAARFNIDLGESVYKMRAFSTSEGERWIVLLNLWRDYIILK